MRYVVDACIAVEYLLRTDLGEQAAPLLEPGGLCAPELLDAEVLHVLRKLVIAGRLDEGRAGEALSDLRAWSGLRRLSHQPLLERAWSLRDNLTGYDALYAAAAAAFEVPVLTADGPLARAPSLGVAVQNLRM